MKRLTIRPERVGGARRALIVVAVCGGVALGGAGIAQAATGGSSTPSAPTAAPGYGGYGGSGVGPAGPGGGPGGHGPGEGKTHAPHLDGTVKSVATGKITILDRDGFTRQIATSDKTTYGTGNASAVKAGVMVHAEGTVDADGVTLDATKVEVRTAPAAGERPEGGGPRGDRPAPPQGAPTAPPTQG